MLNSVRFGNGTKKYSVIAHGQLRRGGYNKVLWNNEGWKDFLWFCKQKFHRSFIL